MSPPERVRLCVCVCLKNASVRRRFGVRTPYRGIGVKDVCCDFCVTQELLLGDSEGFKGKISIGHHML